MKWGMEILSPSSYISGANWLLEGSKGAEWTPAENKMFENALAVYDKDTPDRWQKLAAMIPGKTVGDVIKQYKQLEADVSSIEAGLIPIPGYSASPFTLEWNHGYDEFSKSFGLAGKRSLAGRQQEHERKKGIPWTEEEHKLFLIGLKKYGKGDWRNISRNYVVTRTPTQVASHAQKYFIRQHSGGKDKRRASIHDITTVNLDDTRIPSPSPDNKKSSSSPDLPAAMPRSHFQWNQLGIGGTTASNSPPGNMLISSPYGNEIYSYEQKMRGQSLYGSQSMVFQMPSMHHHHHHG